MPCRRQNKTLQADLMNGERLWQQSCRKFSFVLKEEKLTQSRAAPVDVLLLKKRKEVEHFLK